MNIYLIGVVFMQTTAAAFAVLLNLFLIFVIWSYTKNNLGFYKTILVTFSSFEIVYALIACAGMPGTFIGMTFLGPLVGTRLARFGPTLYCFFFELWLGFIMFLFIYRYFIVCRQEWVDAIKLNSYLKQLIGVGIILYVIACGVCSHFLCTANHISQQVLHEVMDHFDLDNNTVMEYYATRMTNLDGSYSPQSIAALGVHYFYAYGSLMIIGWCSWKIYRTIQSQLKIAKNDKETSMNISLERQLFLSLVIQALIPIVMCNIPSFYILLYPILPDNFLISLLTPLFSLSVTFPKALDPIITIFCIKEYKEAVARLFRGYCWSKGSVEQQQVYSSVVSLSAL